MKKIEAEKTNGHFDLEEFLQKGKHNSYFNYIYGCTPLMIYFIGEGKDLLPEWKEILLLMLGGFIASFSKVVDFWFNNQENDNKLLEHADDLGEK